MSEAVDYARDMVSQHMDKIVKLFIPGAKITVMVRNTTGPKGDFILTSDSPEEILAMVNRRFSKTPESELA